MLNTTTMSNNNIHTKSVDVILIPMIANNAIHCNFCKSGLLTNIFDGLLIIVPVKKCNLLFLVGYIMKHARGTIKEKNYRIFVAGEIWLL